MVPNVAGNEEYYNNTEYCYKHSTPPFDYGYYK